MPLKRMFPRIIRVKDSDLFVHVKPFETWKDELTQDELEADKCPDCMGEGEHECFDCGNVHTCGTCDGKGTLGETSLQDIYMERIRKEANLLSQWLGKITIEESYAD